ncbi:glycosyltransferase family 2 protein [Qingshengfaniella alkalisoli]|uniref:Glycosyltransferase family 2 protein n=1 Tax=Qingshengfaniella alkalisoli TaxID=2599296 RepID=A0A5B8IXZ7_9RHOB|nr:glycosyltransferase family 2 protein [Qingshengfaniella alkalisoli]
MNVSVLILTLNEEENLPSCLAALDWCDDIVVLDSFSTDRTVEIARAAGARVVQRVFDNEPNQRNFGMKEIAFKHAWVYIPDADEICTTELRDEMCAIASDPTRPEAFFLARYRNMFMGRWIRRSSLYPTWMPRFVRPERTRFERLIHCRCVGDGPSGKLTSHYLHYSFNKGLEAWYDKHNRYSSDEAMIATEEVTSQATSWRDLLSPDPTDRRYAIKAIAARLPFRPTQRFLYMYVLRGGILDGWAGFTYCRMLASYELMIVVKTAERRRRQLGQST